MSENQLEGTSCANAPTSRTGDRKRKVVHCENSLASPAENKRLSRSEAGGNETDSLTSISSAEECQGVHDGGKPKECPMSLYLSDDDRPFYDVSLCTNLLIDLFMACRSRPDNNVHFADFWSVSIK